MNDEAKIIDLEIKMAHYEKNLEDLSDVIYKQQVQIENLEKTLNTLQMRLTAESRGDLEIGPANEKPPHY